MGTTLTPRVSPRILPRATLILSPPVLMRAFLSASVLVWLTAAALPAQGTRLLRSPTLSQTQIAFTYGGDYPGTTNDFGQAAQFQQTTECPSPSGPDTTYCSTVLK